MEQRTTPRLGALRIPGEPVDRFSIDAMIARRRPELSGILNVQPSPAALAVGRKLARFETKPLTHRPAGR